MRIPAALAALVFMHGALSAQEAPVSRADFGQTAASQLFGSLETATLKSPAIYGGYSRGCGDGFVELAENGPTWQAMRLSRNRNWGHPRLLDFIKRLSREAVGHGWKGLYVGDMSQPRGGPMKSGHVSHQNGLDVDIWMLPPERLDLTRREREEISSISIRSDDRTGVTDAFTPSHMAILRSAAEDPAVDRVFVSPPAKILMCERAGDDREWLRKIRPLAGHHAHFHVRLKCPPDSGSCKSQRPTVAELSGDGVGCDETLTWWVTEYLDIIKRTPDAFKKDRTPLDYTMAELPQVCSGVLASN